MKERRERERWKMSEMKEEKYIDGKETKDGRKG